MKKGFTLIELLVVIAIIGILSSVVLASLNTARTKGSNAAIKAQLAGLRAQAELYYDSNSPSGYANLCTSATFASMLAQATSTAGSAGACFADGSGWSASAPLKAGDISGMGFWCVGSSGASKGQSANVGSTTSCI